MTSPAGCHFPRDYAACGLRVCALYLLASHDRSGIEIETVRPVSAFEALARHTWRKPLLNGLGRRQALFCVVAAMAQQVPVTRVVRPERTFRLDALTDRIEAHLRKIGG